MELFLTKTQKKAIALERFFPHSIRERVEKTTFALSLLFISLNSLIVVFSPSKFDLLIPVFIGLFLISFSILLSTILLEVYFKYLNKKLLKEGLISFPLLVVLALSLKKKDLVHRLFSTTFGLEALRRIGLAQESLRHFLKNKKEKVLDKKLEGALHHLGEFLHQEDEEFRDFLESAHIDKEHFISALHWIEKKYFKKFSERTLLSPLFDRGLRMSVENALTLEESVRKEINEIEMMYDVIFTEQAIHKIVEYFAEDILKYSSHGEREEFLSGLAEGALISHADLHHANNVILPSDVRSFSIYKKSQDI